MNTECSMFLPNCLFDKDISKIGIVYMNGVDKRCSSGLILSLIPDLDIVIHYTPWCPRLVISLKFDKKCMVSLIDVPFYYSKEVLPVRYMDYLDFNFSDLEDDNEDNED